MGLIQSSRHTPDDLEAWARWERYDRMLATDPDLTAAANRAKKLIKDFTAEGPCHIGISWGKDSVVVAHLAVTAGADAPLVWARADRHENPDCELVRDAFLFAHPTARYEERTYKWRVPLRGDPGFHTSGEGQDALAETMPGRYISGVRAAESGRRKLAMKTHREASTNTCRPIGWWTNEHIWAYTEAHGLPIHPAYGCTWGGRIERSRVRVHALRTAVGDAEWEDRYYPAASPADEPPSDEQTLW